MRFRLPYEDRARGAKQRGLYRLFAALAGLTLLTAFLFSALPRQISSDQSSWLRDFIARITGWEMDVLVLRKLAHLAEYTLIGLFAGAALVQLDWRFLDAARLWALGLPAAFADESIQMFSGRGPAILDVWIDMAGVVIGSCLALLISLMRRRRKAQ